jgi:hypothetical protein
MSPKRIIVPAPIRLRSDLVDDVVAQIVSTIADAWRSAAQHE